VHARPGPHEQPPRRDPDGQVFTNGAVRALPDGEYDLFAPDAEAFADGEDRYVGGMGATTWSLRAEGRVILHLEAGSYLENGPIWGRFLASHFNDTRLGLTGFNSVDSVLFGDPLVIGPSTSMRWSMVFSY
jgi:hypothetical protein